MPPQPAIGSRKKAGAATHGSQTASDEPRRGAGVMPGK